MTKSKEKFITLKEAAKISGYAPDYIGQLIRSGKIEGKQVFSNVAWVTTEEAIREYAKRGKNGTKGSGDSDQSFSVERFFGGRAMKRLYKAGLYVLIGASVLFGLFLFYILSINIDKHLQERAIQKAEERALTVPAPPDDIPQLPL
jgi:hypothetical protein